MNKTDFIVEFAKRTNLSMSEAKDAIDTYHNVLTECLVKKDKVTFPGFGTFQTADRSERKGRNPSTGEPITIQAKTVMQFKPGKALKDAVNI